METITLTKEEMIKTFDLWAKGYIADPTDFLVFASKDYGVRSADYFIELLNEIRNGKQDT
jgi:hypothetical protein